MQVDERVVGDVAIVAVSGEIVLKKAGHATLQDRVRALVEQGHLKVIVDLGAVSFVDSAGLGDLVQASAIVKNKGGVLKLANPTPRLRQMFVLTKLSSIFGIYDDEAQALASFGA